MVSGGTFHMSNLAISSWNIHGIFSRIEGFRYNKLQSPYFWDMIGNAKIFGLIESHHTATEIDQIQIDGFKCFNVCRKKKSNRGRNSGGIAVYVCNTILQGVSKIPTSGSENILIKLNKTFFGLERDVVVTFSYCVPEYSSFQLREQLDVFGDLEFKLSSIGPECDKLCFGDYNARTNNKPDFIISEDNTDIPVPLEIYETDTIGTVPRLNLDTATNKYGDNLLRLCKTVPLRICNGRKLGDILGSFTCITANGQSCVDYCLASPKLYNNVRTLSVGYSNLTLSDHCPLQAVLKVRINTVLLSSDYDFVTKPPKLSWNNDISYRFENILQTPEFSYQFNSYISQNFGPDQTGVDKATDELSSLIIEAALRSDYSIKNNNLVKPTLSTCSKGKAKKRRSHPKWHDKSCGDMHRSVMLTSKLLKGDPRNSYLRGKLFSETKIYNKLIRNKQKEFVDRMFCELDSIHKNNPKGYMDLIKSMRDGNFDREVSDDTSNISPQGWFSHFSDLLSKNVSSKLNTDHSKFVEENLGSFPTELDSPFTKTELLKGLKGLKNNKASSFDQISNEMLKVSGNIIFEPLLKLFNTILNTSVYPSAWKCDILHPIHKSGDKSDPNNFRGIAIASCFGKLFTTLLRNRLQGVCDENNIISKFQGSGKKNSRTADNHMIIKFLFDKIVKGEKKKMYCCFVDIKKAFDFTNRNHMFYKLLNDYEIGGKFLKLLMQLYSDHKVFVRVSEGLLQPITTTIGLKQGCCLSSLLFNLFVNKLPSIFDPSCDPVSVLNERFSCLLWADDLLILSRSSTGLQNAINKTKSFYDSLGLEINERKSKVMIFNGRGLKLDKLPEHKFYMGNNPVEVVDTYQYLGINLKPSGSMQFATSELFDKASRAWFAISNVLYKYKRMSVSRAFQLFDSLIRPVALFSCEFWLPTILPKKCLESKEALIKFWETLQAETLNQKLCRMLLSVHKRCSRLAAIGELGRYPLVISSIKHCLNYDYHLGNVDQDSIVSMAVREMAVLPHLDTWYSRVQKMKSLLGISNLYGSKERVSKLLGNKLNSVFDRFWIDQINAPKLDTAGLDHNKLRFYKTLKGSFTIEPYISNILNKSQRAWLTRYRVSAVSNLRMESGRYTRPVTPVTERFCCYCNSNCIDDEMHAILVCTTFTLKRNCLFGKLSSLIPNFLQLSQDQKLLAILCPATADIALCVSKYLGIISDTRSKLDKGLSNDMLTNYCKT